MHRWSGLSSGSTPGPLWKKTRRSRRYISFHFIYPNVGGACVPSDLSVTLKNGKRLVIEVKRPPWTKPRDQREF